MSPLHLEDRALVKRLKKGDEAAFSIFFERYFPGLFRFSRSRLGDDVAAEEVAQAALCIALRKLPSYRGEASLFSWLCTFCRHEMHAYLKAAQRQPEPIGFLDDVPEIRAVLESGTLDWGTGDLGPELELRRKELAHWVRATLDHLPTHYGQALEWKYLEELSVKAIAARLDMAPKAAESLLTRARAAFRESFDLLSEGFGVSADPRPQTPLLPSTEKGSA